MYVVIKNPFKEVKMAVLTLNIPFAADLVQTLDDYVRREETSREDVINRATWVFLHKQFMAECQAHGKRVGITPEIISEAIKEVSGEEGRN
jgi:metal-responsive CopG/Arc/MetJ family transcriptional regulator